MLDGKWSHLLQSCGTGLDCQRLCYLYDIFLLLIFFSLIVLDLIQPSGLIIFKGCRERLSFKNSSFKDNSSSSWTISSWGTSSSSPLTPVLELSLDPGFVLPSCYLWRAEKYPQKIVLAFPGFHVFFFHFRCLVPLSHPGFSLEVVRDFCFSSSLFSLSQPPLFFKQYPALHPFFDDLSSVLASPYSFSTYRSPLFLELTRSYVLSSKFQFIRINKLI